MKPIRGHALPAEGAPYDAVGRRISDRTTSGVGFARCQCGANSSEPLESANKRRQWHRDHKHRLISSTRPHTTGDVAGGNSHPDTKVQP